MSRFKHVLARSLFAAALIAVPVVPLAAAQPAHHTPHTFSTTYHASGNPACIGCWSVAGS